MTAYSTPEMHHYVNHQMPNHYEVRHLANMCPNVPKYTIMEQHTLQLLVVITTTLLPVTRTLYTLN